MAPNGINNTDRQERRQQRLRGAGPSAVLADFGFNIASLVPQAAKQASLPPPRTRRTPTPVSRTPRGTSSSAKRHRSVSVHRSSSVRRHATPKTLVVTPQLGKRKRGSKDAQAAEDDGELDELSPEQDSHVRSIEQSRKVVGTMSHIREEMDNEPDELSILGDGVGSMRKPVGGTMALARATPLEKTPVPPSNSREKASSANKIGSSIRSRTSAARRSKSTEAPPETPSMPLKARARPSLTQSIAVATPIIIQGDGESEDELTPAQINTSTPRVVGKQPIVDVHPQNDDEGDELSSPAQPGTVIETPTSTAPKEPNKPSEPTKERPGKSTAPAPAKRSRPPRTVLDEEDGIQSTPAVSKPRRKKTSPTEQDADDADNALDELSPEVSRVQKRPTKKKQTAKPIPRDEAPVEISSGDESDQYEPEQEEESMARMPPAPKPKPVNAATDQPPRKRLKFAGPKQAISVMRIKGSTVRGITVADTTRTIVEQNIDHQIQRMAEKLQKTEDSSRRKKLRGDINLALAFKESLNEKLLDLQDANDTLSAGFQKRKLLRNSNIERRREILRIQNSRQEVALELDDEQAAFSSEKEKVEAKSKLSANMFEIQAAIQSGRERARREGREEEGPEKPLSMLLDMVGRQVGSVAGGLLASIQHFNEGLERTAGWLEGRA